MIYQLEYQCSVDHITRKKAKLEGKLGNRLDKPNELAAISGLVACFYHSENIESDNVSDITPIEHDVPKLSCGPRKNSAFDTLFRALFSDTKKTKKLLREPSNDQR